MRGIDRQINIAFHGLPRLAPPGVGVVGSSRADLLYTCYVQDHDYRLSNDLWGGGGGLDGAESLASRAFLHGLRASDPAGVTAGVTAARAAVA